MNTKIEIAELIKEVDINCGSERAAKCAYDCLYQWEAGQLKETMDVWKSYIIEHKNKSGHTETERNGIWVPAIPLKG